MKKDRRTLSKTVGLGVAALAATPAANAATFNVTNLNDNGAGSLRQAIIDANAAAGADVVTFQAGLTGTITLTTGQLSLYDSIDIQGPGASVITVSGNDASRVFYMYSPNPVPFDVTISGLTVTNGADSIGGGIVDFEENLTLDGVVIRNSEAAADGGGLWAAGADATVLIRNSEIDGNTATFFGGGVYIVDANVTIEEDTTITDNEAIVGAGISADGFTLDLTIRDTEISGNTADGAGGGIYVEDTGGPLLIENSVISGNGAPYGGGIYFYDPDNTITIRDTTISGNSALVGGGIYFYYAYAGVLIEGSTISGNTARFGGGMALYRNDGPFEITNSTISGNNVLYAGGGIYGFDFASPLEMNFVTIAQNTAGALGGGLALSNGTVELDNSIIGNNTAPISPDVATLLAEINARFSLIENTTGATVFDFGGNHIGIDPQLEPLADNGGPTETHRPMITPTSPVINAANPAPPAVATDQRGEVRVWQGRADMGSVEVIGGNIQIDPATYSVPENGGGVNITVVRDVGPDPATVQFNTANGSATAGSDYTTTSTTVTFAPGDLSETVNVPILDDTTFEGPETFTASISNPSPGAILGPSTTATVTITDDAQGTAQFSVSSINTTEEAGFVTVTVTRTGGTEGPLVVNYATANGTAVAPMDYGATVGTITFPAGDATPQSFQIPIVNDTVTEGDEMFSVNLTGASVGSSSSLTVVIAASDPEPIPAMSLFGKILFGVMSAIAGLYAVVRNRFSVMLLALLLAGVVAAPSLHAANRPEKQKETKEGKVTGTIQSVTKNGTSIVITLTGGTIVTVPANVTEVVDLRGNTRKRVTLEQVAAGAHVVVRTRKDSGGNVKHVRIRIKP